MSTGRVQMGLSHDALTQWRSPARCWHLGGVFLLALLCVLGFDPVGDAQAQTLPHAARDEAQFQSFAQAVLGREDIRLAGTGYVGLPARAGEAEVTYRTQHCGPWRLPDGALAQAITFEDADARRRQDRLLTRVEGERPALEVYRGYFLGLGRTASDGALRAERLEIPPEALFAEISGCGEPEHSEPHGWVLPLRHTALLYEPQVTRRVFFESLYSLEDLRFVSQRETFEQRYHTDTRTLERLRDGMVVDSQIIQESEDPRAGFVAAGQVLDENGKPAQNVAVWVRWYERYRTSMVSNDSAEKHVTLKTDRDGAFEHRVRRTSKVDVGLYKSGYLPGRYGVWKEEVPKTMRLVPVPVGTVLQGDLYGSVRSAVLQIPGIVGDLSAIGALGFSLDLAKGSSRSVVGWTTNREVSDLWFEFTDPSFAEKHREYLESHLSRHRLDEAGREDWGFEMTVLGLRGTEFAVAPATGEEGLWEHHQYREAPIAGYVTKLTGLVPEERREGVQVPPQTLPKRYYLRKNGCYGKLIGVEFEIDRRPREQPVAHSTEQPDYLRWSVDVDQFAMQARPLGNRLLFVTEERFLVPPWVNDWGRTGRP